MATVGSGRSSKVGMVTDAGQILDLKPSLRIDGIRFGPLDPSAGASVAWFTEVDETLRCTTFLADDGRGGTGGRPPLLTRLVSSSSSRVSRALLFLPEL